MGSAEPRCYHCGLPLLAGHTVEASIGGQPARFCCPGCLAVAQAICASGLEGYYQARTAFASTASSGTDQALAHYDLPEIQQALCEIVGDLGSEREVSLLLDGMTCSACLWLIESTLAAQAGVSAVEVNFVTARARLRWSPALTELSTLLAAVRQIGYRAYPSQSAEAERARQRESRRRLWRLFVAGFGMMQVMMLAVATYLAQDGTMSPDILKLLRGASLVLSVPVIGFSAEPFFRGALRDLRLRRLGMDVPVALGIAIATMASVQAMLTGVGQVYFDSVTMFIFFLLGGRLLEAGARERASAALDYLERCRPQVCERYASWPESGDLEQVPVLALRPGDRLLVRPGQLVPADGRVLEGSTEVDEALLTGESLPMPRGVGARLLEGSVNRGSPVVLEVEAVGERTHAGLLRRLLARATSERPRLVRSADRVAGWLVGIILLVALAGFAAWYPVDPHRALAVAVAVLVVSCPCAFSLATPVALAVATGRLARRGVVLTRGHALESLARATHVAFDKTGTLTRGELSVTAVRGLEGLSPGRALALARALSVRSEHPIARAIVRYGEDVPALPVESRTQVAGQGIEAWVDGRRFRLGRWEFVATLGGLPPQPTDLPPSTLAWLGGGGGGGGDF